MEPRLSHVRVLQNRLLIPLLIGVWAGGVLGHETDQFTVPIGEEFADLGPEWNAMLYDAVEGGVEEVNRDIRRVLEGVEVRRGPHPRLRPRGGKGPAPERDRVTLEQLRSPEEIASRVFNQLPMGALMIEGWEHAVHTDEMQEEHPGKVVGHKPGFGESTYSNLHWIIDPRLPFRIFHASTIMVHGTYLGTDKTGHFTHIGYDYYKAYRRSLRRGNGKEQALRDATKVGSEGLLSESAFLGYLTAGAYSNADMASNYLGMKFYLNLTHPAMIGGRVHEPMLTLEDGLWKVQPHVEPGYFAIFISDHFNEALNPSLFEPGMRDAVREAVEERCESLLDWYAGDDPDKRNATYFQSVLDELKTYHGEDYGHRGEGDELVTIANTCF